MGYPDGEVVMVVNALPYAKGHGTGNDFVIVPDPDGELDLPATLVAALCDRRRGLGGDGLLRVVRTAAVLRAGAVLGAGAAAELAAKVADLAGGAGAPEWFMDYRNADGSLAQMCGNGVRVYARYLVRAGLATGPSVPILTRSGPVVATVGGAGPDGAGPDGDVVAVDLPPPEVLGGSIAVLHGVSYPGTVATCGNPNLVCRVTDAATLDLTGVTTGALALDPVTFPTGANVELITAVDDLRVRMRVVERGVGETLSCGSGAVAAAAVVLRDAGRAEGTVGVDLPGGRLTVTVENGRWTLAGQAVIVATGHIDIDAILAIDAVRSR